LGFFSAVRTTFLPFDCKPKSGHFAFWTWKYLLLGLQVSIYGIWEWMWAFWGAKKRFRGGDILVPLNLKKFKIVFFCLFWAPPIVHTPFTGVALMEIERPMINFPLIRTAWNKKVVLSVLMNHEIQAIFTPGLCSSLRSSVQGSI
jgi:hypothetical protein